MVLVEYTVMKVKKESESSSSFKTQHKLSSTKLYIKIRDTVFTIVNTVVNKFVNIKTIYFHKFLNIVIGNILSLISSLYDATTFKNM